MTHENHISRQRRPERRVEAPKDKPRIDRGEHANLERPGAQFHPLALARRPADPARGAWEHGRPW
jgi:hypothetical protein